MGAPLSPGAGVSMRGMKSPVFALAAIAALPFAACQTISSAPEGSPRVEVELLVEVADDVYAPFHADVARDEINAIIEETIFPIADVGLRFYPVHSGVYQPDDDRPEYLLKVRIESFDVVLDHTMVEEEGVDPWILTEIATVECSTHAIFEKRRPNAPPLPVGSETVSGAARVDPEPPGTFLLQYEPLTGERLLLSRVAIEDAVNNAVKRVLIKLQKPIDREFEPKVVDRREP